MFPFNVVDVFTETRFAGNPLAVVHDADALKPAQMQAVARESGFYETAFVLRHAAPAHDARVRIFTPTTEVPSAGHANIGTAFVVAGRAARPPQRLMFEESTGLVALEVLRENEMVVGAQLTGPERLSTGRAFVPEAAASALHLTPDDIAATLHPPMMASVGLPFPVVEIAGRAALARARPDAAAFAALVAGEVLDAIYLYTRETAAADGAVDWTARIFAPADGVTEDPAVGSATAALAALLASRDARFAGRVLRVAQGIERGRPSLREPEVLSDCMVRLAGRCVSVMDGMITV